MNCGLLVAQPQASEAEMDFYYERVFFEEHWPDAESQWAITSDVYRRHEFPLMQRLWADWPPPMGGAVVEIGCGYGVLLGLLREAGYNARGYEMSGKAVAFCRARRLDVVEGKGPGVPLPRGTFDVSVAMQVIEHVADPRGFVKDLVELVRPGGVIVLVTEDSWISQYAWDRCRARLLGRIPPFRSSTDHTFVFRGGHLEALLSEAGCDDVRARAFSYVPDGESPHWRLYKGFFRTFDRVLGHGEYLMAVGRRGSEAVSG